MAQLPPWILPDLEICRIAFEEEEFRRVILQAGLRVWWEQASDCPCSALRTIGGKTAATKEPYGDCPACAGSSVLYDEGQQTIAMFTHTREEQRKYNTYGPLATGYANLTLLPENLPGYNDRFTLIDAWRVHTEVRIHATTVESLRYPIQRRPIRVGSGPKLTTPTTKTIGVIHCRVAGLDGRILSGVRVEGIDFVVTATGQIDWSLGEGLDTAPAVGAAATYRYFARPCFTVQDHIYLQRNGYVHDAQLDLGVGPVSVLVIADFLGLKSPPVANFNPSPTFPMPG